MSETVHPESWRFDNSSKSDPEVINRLRKNLGHQPNQGRLRMFFENFPSTVRELVLGSTGSAESIKNIPYNKR